MYKGVVMVAEPVIHEVVGKVFLERIQGSDSLPVAEFWDLPTVSNDQMLVWERVDLYPVGIGEEKWDKEGLGSAAGVVVNKFGHIPSEAEAKLLALLADNNQTGKLRAYHMSVTALIRNLYLIDGYDHNEIVGRAGDVVNCWLKTQDGEGDRNADQGLEGAFQDLVLEVDKGNFAPLTVHRYLRDLWRLGHSADEVRERVSFWTRGWYRVGLEVQQAQTEFRQLPQKSFGAGGFLGLAIDTANPFVVKYAARSVGVLVAKNTATGHVAILTDHLDLSAFAAELIQKEPGRWHHNKRQGQVLNGGRYKGVTPTATSLDELVSLLEKYPPRRSQAARR